MEQFNSPTRDFGKILYFNVFRKSIKNIQFSLKFRKTNGSFTRSPIYILIISTSVLHTIRNISEKIRVKIKTHILLSINLLSKISPFITMWKNIVEPDRPQMAKRRMHIACYITNATNTHSEYVIITDFLLQQWLHERAAILR